jgi:hypothetical protein
MLQLKIMIVGSKDFFDPLGKIGKDTINENLFCICIPYPKDWNEEVYKFVNEVWEVYKHFSN